jgi:4-hydroxy-tetrahydrodipicolinate synthase
MSSSTMNVALPTVDFGNGVFPPILTPLTANGDIDDVSLAAVTSRALRHRVDGVFALGSSGDAIYFNDRDRRHIAEVIIDAAGGKVPVLVSALDATADRVIERLEALRGLRFDAVVVTGPYYADLTDVEVIRHFEMIARKVPVPLVAYDIPANTHRKLSAGIVNELLNRGLIVGVKDSSGDLAGLRQVANEKPREGLGIFTGSDVLADISLAVGANGLVAGLANVAPHLFVSLREAFANDDAADVAAIQSRIGILARVYGVGKRYGLGRNSSEIGGLKVALTTLGVIATATAKSPMLTMPDESRAEVQAIVEEAAVMV